MDNKYRYLDYESKLITKVMIGFLNNKHALVEHLFPGAVREYKIEWHDRKPCEFWCHLDPQNKEKTIKFFEEA